MLRPFSALIILILLIIPVNAGILNVIYTNTEETPKTYFIPDEKIDFRSDEQIEKRWEKRRLYSQIRKDKQDFEKCIKEITQNWRRRFGCQIYKGYDKGLDKRWKDEQWHDWMNGEKICPWIREIKKQERTIPEITVETEQR